MNITALNLVYDLLLITIPTLAIGGFLFLVIRTFITRDQDLRRAELRAAFGKDTLLLRLQAYERLTLLLERMSPASVISRVIDIHMMNNELQLAMIRDIKNEFEHNLSQQVYVSSDAWNLIVQAKEEIIKAIGLIANHMPADTDAPQVARVILESISKSGQMLPNQTALEFLKHEARGLM